MTIEFTSNDKGIASDVSKSLATSYTEFFSTGTTLQSEDKDVGLFFEVIAGIAGITAGVASIVSGAGNVNSSDNKSHSFLAVNSHLKYCMGIEYAGASQSKGNPQSSASTLIIPPFQNGNITLNNDIPDNAYMVITLSISNGEKCDSIDIQYEFADGVIQAVYMHNHTTDDLHYANNVESRFDLRNGYWTCPLSWGESIYVITSASSYQNTGNMKIDVILKTA